MLKYFKDHILSLIVGALLGGVITAASMIGILDVFTYESSKDFWQTVGSITAGLGTIGLFILALIGLNDWKQKKAIEIAHTEIERILNHKNFRELSSDIQSLFVYNKQHPQQNESASDCASRHLKALKTRPINLSLKPVLASLKLISGSGALTSIQKDISKAITDIQSFISQIDDLTIDNAESRLPKIEEEAKQLSTDIFNYVSSWLDYIFRS